MSRNFIVFLSVRLCCTARFVSLVREQDGWVSVASEETTDRFADVSDAFSVCVFEYEYSVRFLAGCWFTASRCVTVSFD